MDLFETGYLMGVLIAAMAIMLLPVIFYLLTLQSALSRVSPELRKLEPGLVWLMLIPVFNVIWHFIIVSKMADSIQAEFHKRGVAPDEDRPGYSIGLAMCILICCGIIPIVGVLASVAAFVLWIIYWVKIAGYKSRLPVISLRSDILDDIK